LTSRSSNLPSGGLFFFFFFGTLLVMISSFSCPFSFSFPFFSLGKSPFQLATMHGLCMDRRFAHEFCSISLRQRSRAADGPRPFTRPSLTYFSFSSTQLHAPNERHLRCACFFFFLFNFPLASGPEKPFPWPFALCFFPPPVLFFFAAAPTPTSEVPCVFFCGVFNRPDIGIDF